MSLLGSTPQALLGPKGQPRTAVRDTRPGWRDPRLWIGLAMVAGSVIGGYRLLADAERTTAVWVAETDVHPGDPVTDEVLTTRDVRFADAGALDRYLVATRPIVAGTRATRTIGAGELVARSALGQSSDSGIVEVPLSVQSEQLPPSVGAGSIVDVWVAAPDASKKKDADLILAAVVVIEAPRASDGFGGGERRQLVIGVPPEQAGGLPGALGAAAAGQIIVTRQG
ncbi:MAG: hypothetical protein ACRCYQ_07405 [Nocardioides sp.]